MARPATDLRADRGKLWSRWLREQLRDRALTQEQGARELDVTVSCMARWISGRNLPSFENLMTIRERWGVLPDMATFALGRIDSESLESLGAILLSPIAHKPVKKNSTESLSQRSTSRRRAA